MTLSPRERTLAYFLVFEAVCLLAAVPASLLPTSTMSAIHQNAGLGPMPEAPLVEYLTRSASWVYASWGFFYAYVVWDVRRYFSLLRYLAVTKGLFALGMLALDLWVGMPLLWIACEGPGILSMAFGQWVLTRRAEADGALRSVGNSGDKPQPGGE